MDCLRARKCLSLALVVCSAGNPGRAANAAARAYREGQKAERSGDHLEAYFLYAEAAQADAKNPLYSRRMAALARNAALQPRMQVLPDPANETKLAQLEEAGLISGVGLDSPPASGPPQLLTPAGKRNFTINGSARDSFEKIGDACGVRVLFAPDYQEPRPVKFAVADVTCTEALRALEAATDSFVVPLNASTAMVARDTPQNRTQFTPVVAIAVPIPERISVQEGQEMATAVQQTLEIRRISLDAGRRVVYFRDSALKVFAAREMFERLAHLRAQVAVEVEFLEMSTTSSLAYGLSLPTSANIVDFGLVTPGSTSGVLPTIPPGTPGLAAVGGGKSLLGVGIGNSTVIATLGKSSTTTLLHSQIAAADGQAMTLRVGDRYPITTSQYSGTTPQTAGTAFYPTVNYVDLGLGLKITPAVHESGEVTMDIEAEFKSLGATNVNGNPTIGNQQYQGKVRLKQGEWAVVAGLLQITHTNNPTGIPWLMNIPILGSLFSSRSREDDRSEVLLILKPHITAEPVWEEEAGDPIWTGSETRPVTVF